MVDWKNYGLNPNQKYKSIDGKEIKLNETKVGKAKNTKPKKKIVFTSKSIKKIGSKIWDTQSRIKFKLKARRR